MIINNLKKRLYSLFADPNRFGYLCKFPIFNNFNNLELSLFSQIIHERHFQAGEVIYREEFPLAVIYLIAKGEVELKELVGEKMVTEVLIPPHFLGIIDMYNETRRNGEARALQDTTLYAVSHLDFREFIKSNPKTGVKLLNNICEALSQFVVDLQNSLQA